MCASHADRFKVLVRLDEVEVFGEELVPDVFKPAVSVRIWLQLPLQIHSRVSSYVVTGPEDARGKLEVDVAVDEGPVTMRFESGRTSAANPSIITSYRKRSTLGLV